MAPGGNIYEDDATESCADYGSLRLCGPANGRLGMASNSGVQELLKCPVCVTVMCPPIHQCPNGHTICVMCKTKVQNVCLMCREELGNIRCLALEKVAESIELPCKYESNGCQDILPYHNRMRHEKNCKHRGYNCPYAGVECPVTGDIPFIVSHLKTDHNVDMHDGSSFNHRYVKPNPHEIENATWMLTVTVSGTSFVCILKRFISGMHLFTWRFCGSWVMKMMRISLVTVSRSEVAGGK